MGLGFMYLAVFLIYFFKIGLRKKIGGGGSSLMAWFSLVWHAIGGGGGEKRRLPGLSTWPMLNQ